MLPPQFISMDDLCGGVLCFCLNDFGTNLHPGICFSSWDSLALHICEMHTQNGLFIMLVCACYVMCCFGAHIDLSTTDKGRYKHGKAKLTELRSRSQSQTPYGSCWTAALQSLETGCRHLTDDVQHELTLKFLRCFLLKTG